MGLSSNKKVETETEILVKQFRETCDIFYHEGNYWKSIIPRNWPLETTDYKLNSSQISFWDYCFHHKVKEYMYYKHIRFS